MFCSVPSSAGVGDAINLTSDVPFCGHISSSSLANYTIYIEPQTSEASFVLRWRDEGSILDLTLFSPQGRVISSTSSDCIRDKTSLSYTISKPEWGRWMVEVKSGSLPKRGEDYCVLIEPEVRTAKAYTNKIQFSGLYHDYGQDEDGDGLNELVILKVGVNVRKAGLYTLEGLLYDVNDGKEIPVGNTSYLNFGSKILELELSGMRTPGPYRLKSLVIYDENGDLVAETTAEYSTREYRNLVMGGNLVTRNAKLNGSYSDHGSDINGDGWYDYLTVDVGVDIYSPGSYNLMGFLCDANGTQLVWSLSYGNFSPGTYVMHMDFDGKSLWMSRVNGPYYLKDLVLSYGDSVENMSDEDCAVEDYITDSYNYSQFVDPIWPDKVLSGHGFGEILLTISVQSILPVFQGRYSYDIAGVNMPPITSNWTVESVNDRYVYDLPGVHMPGMPNNFTITASGVKNLNVGVRKQQNPGSDDSYFRSWVSSQALAGEDGTAVVESDRISPGRYQFKVFGDAADDADHVDLEMTVIKKLVINGDFTLTLNTTGFPSGNYSIGARALNGSLRFDEITLEGPS